MTNVQTCKCLSFLTLLRQVFLSTHVNFIDGTKIKKFLDALKEKEREKIDAPTRFLKLQEDNSEHQVFSTVVCFSKESEKKIQF